MLLDLRQVKTTDFNLSWQHQATIARFNKVIDKKFDYGSAEMLYKLSRNSYKKQFWSFCNRNHLQIVIDYVDSERYQQWLSYQPDTNQIDEPQTYGEATMRHSDKED